MWKYVKALFYMLTGRLTKARQTLMENEYVMGATYDNAIAKGQGRFETVKSAVAELIRISNDRKSQIKEIGGAVERLTKVKTGAQVAMQKRLDELKAKGLTKEDILKDAEFIKHNGAFNDASSTLNEKLKQMKEKEEDLASRERQIATYKSELQSMQRSNTALAEEKNEAIADVKIAQQNEAINSLLSGIPTNEADKDLQEAREARKRAQARQQISSELAGNDAKLAENAYLDYAAHVEANTELDKLLNWGDESKESKKDLDPAKLPE